jgi:circadian clock protein KaiC
MDAWLLLSNLQANGERTRALQVIKARGMPHSNQVREFVLCDSGIDLVDVYVGADRVVTGSARVAQEALDQSTAARHKQQHQRNLRQMTSKRKALEAQIAALQAAVDTDAAEMEFLVADENIAATDAQRNSEKLLRQRRALKNGNARTKSKR